MIDLPLMSNNISGEDVACLIDFLQNNDVFTQSKKVREFEAAWSNWLGVEHSLFVNSGSSANFITMHVIAELYGKGEVIVAPIGWSSDIAAVINAGHRPVFADVNLSNLSMNENEILSKVTENTKAVLLTHVLGFNALSDKLIETLKEKNIVLIEDCCESHGATHKGKRIGSFGKASNFSFYYAHHMSTIEGGMICTDDDEFHQYCRMFRSHGMIRECDDDNLKKIFEKQNPETHPEFTFVVPGFNMRSTELNAVIGLNQLKRLDENNPKRTQNFKLFLDNLDPEKYYTDFDLEGSVNYALILLLRKSDKEFFGRVCDVLREEKVEFRRGTAGGGNLVRQGFVRSRYPEINPGELKNAEFIHENGMYIGNYPDLDQDKILALCKVLNRM